MTTTKKKGNHMNRNEVLSIIDEARKTKKNPNLENADLQGINLQGNILSGANLRGANLRGSNLATVDLDFSDLTGADLSGADLTHANLMDASLWGANLSRANLTEAQLEDAILAEANMVGATLREANLYGVNLQDTNLTNVCLEDANLSHTLWKGLRIDCLPSHQLTLIPTPHGWDLQVNLWRGTPDYLRELMTQEEEWPESVMGDSLDRCCPYLEAALALCDVHMNDHADYIYELKGKWNV